jgi:RimJ/RimL family protein N-acetyltransferase
MHSSISSLSDWKPVQPAGPVTLRGRTVTLEPLSADLHAVDLWQAVRPPQQQSSVAEDAGIPGNDDVWTYLFDGPYGNEADFRKAVEQKQAASGTVFLAIVPGPTGKAAGWASFMRMEPAHGVIEVGNILLSPGLQRTTAATEAMFLMAKHVFDHLGYRRYEWKCNAENEPSRRAALRLGFTFEGIFRQHMVVKGRNRDTAWFSMLDREWPERKRAFEAWLDKGNFDERGRQRKSLNR